MPNFTRTLPAQLRTIANSLVSKGFTSHTTRSQNRGVKCVSFTKNDDQVVINEDGYIELFTSNRNAYAQNDCGWHQMYAYSEKDAQETLDFILRTTGND